MPAARNPVRNAGGATYEVERAGEIKHVVDEVQVIEVRRLSEPDEGQPVSGVIGIHQVAKVIAKLMVSTVQR